ncbi:putative glycoside hydrolase [Vibrio sp. FNV 38]|nr:putative glycoside hydrolase [Vibrio sp. FNV 38]
MNTKQKILALIVASAFGLTGCLSDDKPTDGDNGGDNGGGGEIHGGKLKNQIPIYFKEPGNYEHDFTQVNAVDATGNSYQVNGSALPDESNINVVSDDFKSYLPLTVSVNEGEASLQFSAEKLYNISAANNNSNLSLGGSLQLQIDTQSYDIGDRQEPNRVYLTIGQLEEDGETHRVDVTSAFVSSQGKVKPLRIPLNCYLEGVDLTNVDLALAIESTGPIAYTLSQARLADNSFPDINAGSNLNFNLQDCFTESKVLTAKQATLLSATPTDDGWTFDGEFEDLRVGTRGTKIEFEYNDGTSGAIGVYYDEKFDTKMATPFNLAINTADKLTSMDTPRLDFSHYLTEGELQFDIIIPQDSAEIPTQGNLELALRFWTPNGNTTEGIIDSGGYGQSEYVYFDLSTAGIEKGQPLKVTVPISKFYTNSNGFTKVNALQYVERLETLLRVNNNGTISFVDLQDFKHGLGDVKLVLPAD